MRGAQSFRPGVTLPLRRALLEVMIHVSERPRRIGRFRWVVTLVRAMAGLPRRLTTVGRGALPPIRSGQPAPPAPRATAPPIHFHVEHRLVTVALSAGLPLVDAVSCEAVAGTVPSSRVRCRAGAARAVGSAKAAVDLLVASMALLLTLPLLIAAAFAVRLSGPGPVFCRRPGIGARDQPVELVRFRTAVAGRRSATGPAAQGASGLTATGRLLRATGIDTLPQLLNLARGDISLFRAASVGADSTAGRAFPKAA